MTVAAGAEIARAQLTAGLDRVQEMEFGGQRGASRHHFKDLMLQGSAHLV
jgi:hypothetical protein